MDVMALDCSLPKPKETTNVGPYDDNADIGAMPQMVMITWGSSLQFVNCLNES